MTSKFYDSTEPDNIPNGSDVVLYGDGKYVQTKYPYHRFGRVRWNTVLGTGDCGAADYEKGNPVYNAGRLKQWAQYRHANNWRARVYCDRADIGRAIHELGDVPRVWWIATLDGHQWTSAALLENIKETEKIVIPPNQLWACQYAGGLTAKYDTSILYGPW